MIPIRDIRLLIRDTRRPAGRFVVSLLEGGWMADLPQSRHAPHGPIRVEYAFQPGLGNLECSILLDSRTNQIRRETTVRAKKQPIDWTTINNLLNIARTERTETQVDIRVTEAGEYRVFVEIVQA